MKNLEAIKEAYCNRNYNIDNYYIGGGLDNSKFASNRHEDAKYDPGKITFGNACQMFKKATNLELDFVKEIIHYAVPNMEWHHAGKLPKAYGGGMKKTYFLNASEICDLSTNWSDYVSKLELHKNQKRINEESKRNLESRKQEYLKANAVYISRSLRVALPEYFYEVDREMNGKYGWFSSYGKSYNLTEYYSGWGFKDEVTYNEFLNIK